MVDESIQEAEHYFSKFIHTYIHTNIQILLTHP